MRQDALMLLAGDPNYHENIVETYRKLAQRWRLAFPDAALETSAALKPLMRDERYEKSTKAQPDEIWFNDTYYVLLRRHDEDKLFGMPGGMIQLGIQTLDGTARHDFRELQAIKNQLAGAECEAFELYPAESRLVDPSNHFTLWCFRGLRRLKIGASVREVFDADMAIGPQRAFPPDQGSQGGQTI